MPSTTSSSVSRLLASSTVMTPSLPTCFIASARNFPISASPLAEMVPTWAISSLEVTFFEFFFRSSTTCSTARSMPRLRSIGFMPAATDLEPSLTIAWARTVAVVVPSPAKSEDFEATSRTICAPMFSNLSSSSISLATVTPSLVIRGAPYDLSSTTLRPLGPSVTRTAWARVSMPRSILSRASTANFTSLADMSETPQRNCCLCSITRLPPSPTETSSRSLLARFGLDQHPHDVAFLHDQVLDFVNLDLGSRPLAEQHLVANLDVDRDQLAALVAAARADGDHLAALRLFLGVIRNDDACGGSCLGFDTFDDDTVVEWTEFHWYLLVQTYQPTYSCSSRGGTVTGASIRAGQK